MIKSPKNIISFLGILISIISLAIVFRRVEMGLFWETLKNIRIFPFTLMFVLYVFGFLLRGLRSQIMLKPLKKLGFKRASAPIFIGHMVNNILPARLGEVFRAYITGKKEGISKTSVFGSIAIEHIFDGLFLLGIFSVTAMFAELNPEYSGVIKKFGLTGGFIFLTATVCVLFARVKGPWVKRISRKIINLFRSDRIKKSLDGWTLGLINSTSFLKLDRSLPTFLFLTAMIWVTEGAVFLFALQALNLVLNPLLAFFALSFTSLGLATPSAPAHVGVFQGLVLMVFTFFGLDGNSALAYSVINHVVMVVPITLIGLMFLNMYGESIWHFKNK